MTEGLGYGSERHNSYNFYDIYEDYDNPDFKGNTSKLRLSSSTTGTWQCLICTYENEQNSLSCDICGVSRDSSGKVYHIELEEVHGQSEEYGVSIMAKSLFHPSSKRDVKVGVIKENLLENETSISCKKGYGLSSFNQQQTTTAKPYPTRWGRLHGSYDVIITVPELYSALLTVPFKFDTPSPDDIVSTGKRSSRDFSKGSEFTLSKSSETSSKVGGKKSNGKLFLEDEASEDAFATASRGSNINENENSNTNDSKDGIQKLTRNLGKLKMDKPSANSRIRKVKINVQYKQEKWITPVEEGTMNQLNLAIVGHVDSGKSSLCGRLLQLFGQISKKDMHKYEKESKEKGKGSFAYAWAMDESAEERERGITMTVAVAYFATKKYRVVLLDSPGHKDFVPSMISSVTQADAAVLVIDASLGSFEAGMGGHDIGQTKEHAQLIRSFGIEQIIVAVNKMDLVEFSQKRFVDIKLQLGHFLRSCGFKESLLMWIPLSAIENQNLIGAASDIRLSSWYEGCCLLDAIDSLQPPNRDVTKPLLLPICDVLTRQSLGQVAICGKIEVGAIQTGSKVLVMPSGEIGTIRTIERDSSSCGFARAGDNVSLGLHGIDAGSLSRGGVICHPDFPVSVTSTLELKILVLDTKTPILIGSQVELHIHHSKEVARVVKLISLLDQKTGKASKSQPRMLKARQSALIEVILDGEVFVEEFLSCRTLGRVILRHSGNTIAVGIVTRILEQEF